MVAINFITRNPKFYYDVEYATIEFEIDDIKSLFSFKHIFKTYLSKKNNWLIEYVYLMMHMYLDDQMQPTKTKTLKFLLASDPSEYKRYKEALLSCVFSCLRYINYHYTISYQNGNFHKAIKYLVSLNNDEINKGLKTNGLSIYS